MKSIYLFMLIILLSAAVTAQPGNFGYGDFDEPFMHEDCEGVIDKLDLTKEQKDRIDDLRINHKKEMVDLRAELEKRKIELRETRNKDNFTRNEVIAAIENLNKIKNEIALKAANHRMDIYEQLTAEQKATWKENKNDCKGMHKKFRKRIHRDD